MMWKIVTGRRMAEIDRQTIDHRGISGDRLMENAGQGAARYLLERGLMTPGGEMAAILCGKGNNGGDGLVIARVLAESDVPVQVILFCTPESLQGDPATNWKRLPEEVRNSAIVLNPDKQGVPVPPAYLETLVRSSLIVDAVFGTGFEGEIRPGWACFFEPLQDLGGKIFAIDMPSGVSSEDGSSATRALSAQWTVTMGLPKRGQLLGDGVDKTGFLKILDIGFPADLTAADETDACLISPEVIQSLLPDLRMTLHKGQAGRVLIVAGSRGMTGAAVLTSEAALLSGAGLVTLAAPESLNSILETKLTEPMTLPLEENPPGELSENATDAILVFAENCSALAIGPGLGRSLSTESMVRNVLASYSGPVVVDADALYVVGDHPEIVHGKPAVLTPHPGELAALLGKSVTDIQSDRWRAAQEAAAQFGCVVILKGARTVVAATDGRLRINSTGNPAMASGGMGDVLTGLTAALLGRGMPPFEAAQAAVFCHGLAADLVLMETHYGVITAQDVLGAIRESLSRLKLNQWEDIFPPSPPAGWLSGVTLGEDLKPSMEG